MPDSPENIKIRQTWLEDEVFALSKELNMDNDNSFLYLVASLLLEISPQDLEPADIVDGGQDKQLDVIHIDDDPERGYASVTIIQCKNSSGFKSNDVIKIKNGLDWVFERPRLELANLPNTTLKNKIEEIRELRTSYGMSNVSVSIFHVTAGDRATETSDEYVDERNGLTSKYENVGFDEFIFDHLGAHEIIEILSLSEQTKKKIDIDIPIVYDANQASVIKFSQGDTKSFLCTVSGEALAKIASSEPRDSIFDLNVRPYYGSRGKVNRDIYKTCISADAQRFWFLNNGVTMVCDSFDFNSDTDNPILKVKNAQIVNGCQTSVTIREASDKGELEDTVRVLLRVYSTDNPNLVEKITLTTNSQNRVTDRDLRANDSVQRDIEYRMKEKYGYFYERKNKQFRHLVGPNKKKIVPSPKAAQAYLAIVRRKPGNARGYLGAIWSDYYSEIFKNSTIDDLLLSFKIYRYCQEKSLETRKLQISDVNISETRIYGLFHIARVIGYKLLADKWGNTNMAKVEKLLKSDNLEEQLESHYQSALNLVKACRERELNDYPITALYFKTRKSQDAVNRELHII